MTISKVISFLSGNERRDVDPGTLTGFLGANGSSARSIRMRDATRETAPLENLMGQLRDIIVGPQSRLNEARFEEMLDILEEQKLSGDNRLDQLKLSLAEAVDHLVQMEGRLEEQNGEISELRKALEQQAQAMHEEQTVLLPELRNGFEKRLSVLSEVLEKRTVDFETSVRGDLVQLSSSLSRHFSDQDKKWVEERNSTLLTLEQRIAQWRAELADERREDMDQLGSSMVDLGRRILALQNH